MSKRQIAFEIDNEIADHLDWLAKEWKKDPLWLARAFFEEELKSNVAGSRGVPLLRRYMYRDPQIYFTAEELAEREAERERRRDPAETAENKRLLERLESAVKKRKEGCA
jgi:hypothetical protein